MIAFPPGSGSAAAAAPQKVQLVITLDLATGGVSIGGPLHDKTLCYGMLERARDAIHEFDPAKQSGLAIVQGGLVG